MTRSWVVRALTAPKRVRAPVLMLLLWSRTSSLLSPIIEFHQLNKWIAVKVTHPKAHTWSWAWIHVLCVVWVCFVLQWWMSRATYGTNSSGTGSFPNVTTVNMIIVQMNVNSSTIIVQLEYCVHYHSTSWPFTLSRVWRCSRPMAFCNFLFFLILSGLCHKHSCRTEKCTTHATKPEWCK